MARRLSTPAIVGELTAPMSTAMHWSSRKELATSIRSLSLSSKCHVPPGLRVSRNSSARRFKTVRLRAACLAPHLLSVLPLVQSLDHIGRRDNHAKVQLGATH